MVGTDDVGSDDVEPWRSVVAFDWRHAGDARIVHDDINLSESIDDSPDASRRHSSDREHPLRQQATARPFRLGLLEWTSARTVRRWRPSVRSFLAMARPMPRLAPVIMATLFMDIDGKVALITGSAKRIGRAVALELARRGARIAVHYRSS